MENQVNYFPLEINIPLPLLCQYLNGVLTYEFFGVFMASYSYGWSLLPCREVAARNRGALLVRIG
ncbi:hypothetical protein D3C85_1011270 [compost metagenome]